MAKTLKPDVEVNPGSLVKAAAKAEKRLLKAEAEAAEFVAVAERRSMKAEAKFNKAKARYDLRLAELKAAEEELRRCQSARALGPIVGGSSADDSGLVAAPESDASPLPQPSTDAEPGE